MWYIIHISGGAIFGIGWALSGYCPGTCIVGSSEGKSDAIATLIGALVGAFIFALAYPVIERTVLAPANLGSITLESVLGVQGIYIAIPFSALLLFLAFFVLKDRYE